MTLAAFQMAMADFAASPALCREVRGDPGVLRGRYELTEREWRQLVGVVGGRGMEAVCMLYRANRLAPVAADLRLLGERAGHQCEFFGGGGSVLPVPRRARGCAGGGAGGAGAGAWGVGGAGGV